MCQINNYNTMTSQVSQSCGQGFITKEHIAICTNFKSTQYSSIFKNSTKPILSLHNHSPLLFLNAQYTDVMPTLSVAGLCLVTNVQLLKCLLQ